MKKKNQISFICSALYVSSQLCLDSIGVYCCLHFTESTREAFQAIPFQGNINIYLGFLHLVLQCVEKMHKLVNYSLQQLVTRKSE